MSGFEDTSDFFKTWKSEHLSNNKDVNAADENALDSDGPPMFRNDLPVDVSVFEADSNVFDAYDYDAAAGDIPFFQSALEKAKISKPEYKPNPTDVSNAVKANEVITRQAGIVANDTATISDANARDRRDRKQTGSRTIGNVVSCSGSSVEIAASFRGGTFAADAWTVGQMISIVGEGGRIVALVREIKTESAQWDESTANAIVVKADMVGEVVDKGGGDTAFKRGISKYPKIGAIAHKIRTADLESVFDLGGRIGVEIGSLSQNNDIPAIIGVDDILRRHFAIVGTTGVGKSCAVSLVVSRAMQVDPNLRVLMLDPHNEFAGAFGNKAHQLDASKIDLPYWLFTFEEIEDVIFRGRPKLEESDILRELIMAAKMERTVANPIKTPQGVKSDATLINIDTPVPYRMGDVLRMIDDILGQLEPRFSRVLLRSIKLKLEMLEANPRYKFLFMSNGSDDSLENIISDIFRLPANGKSMTTVNLSGLPSEVVNCVASVLARLSFEVAHASNGAIKVLLVCEEAHRYVPADRSLSFEPTRRAISRIAKEGRKYGCAVAVVTQRPGELDPTILSQCSTVFAMRLANDVDQDIIRSALSDSSAAIVSFLSSLDNREAIAFGEGVQVPMRLYFNDYDIAKMRREIGMRRENNAALNADSVNTGNLVRSIRGITSQMIHNEVKSENGLNSNKSSYGEPAQSALARSPLVRRPLSEALKNEKFVKEVESLKSSSVNHHGNGFGNNSGLRR